MKKRVMKYLLSASSILDLSPSGVYVISAKAKKQDPQMEDAMALSGDWLAVGDELRSAMKKHDRISRKQRIATCE